MAKTISFEREVALALMNTNNCESRFWIDIDANIPPKTRNVSTEMDVPPLMWLKSVDLNCEQNKIMWI